MNRSPLVFPLVLTLTLTLTAIACGTKPGPDLKPRPQLGGLLIICEPVQAQIFVDDKYMGTTKGLDKGPLMLSPGMHRIEIRHEGYFAHFAEVELARGVKQILRVKLRKEPF